MFGDFHGYSRLSDRQMLTFYNQMMQRIAAVLDRFAGDVAARNTWGDGLFVVFEDLGRRRAAQCKSNRPWQGSISSRSACRQASACGLASTPGQYSQVQDPIFNIADLYWHPYQPHRAT